MTQRPLIAILLVVALAATPALAEVRFGDADRNQLPIPNTTDVGLSFHSFDGPSIGVYTPPAGTDLPLPAQLTDGCDAQVGILGGYFFAEVSNFLLANGATPVGSSCAAIQAGQLDGLDVLYVNRFGLADLMGCCAEIDAWVRGGGTLITEFTASDGVFGCLGYLAGVLSVPVNIPSGNVCGGNTILVADGSHPVAEGLPGSWDCSGDPNGIYRVYDAIAESGPGVSNLVTVTTLDVDADANGLNDEQALAFCVDQGNVVAFLSDFGDWQTLDADRGDPDCDITCERDVHDETLFINAVCRSQSACEEDCGICPDPCPDIDLTILDDIKAEIVDIKSELVDVKAEVTDIDQDVADVDADVADVKAEIVDIKAEIVDLDQDIIDVSAQITDVKAEVTDIKAEVTDVEAEVTDVKAEIQAIEVKLDMLPCELVDLLLPLIPGGTLVSTHPCFNGEEFAPESPVLENPGNLRGEDQLRPSGGVRIQRR